MLLPRRKAGSRTSLPLNSRFLLKACTDKLSLDNGDCDFFNSLLGYTELYYFLVFSQSFPFANVGLIYAIASKKFSAIGGGQAGEEAEFLNE